MAKRKGIAAVVLLGVVALIAVVVLLSIQPAEEPDGHVTPPPANGAPAEFDHTTETGTCSICHAPTPAHAAMEFNRCEDCHAYPTWDAQHPEATDCATCHKYDPPAVHPAITTTCVTCHPKVGESWQFVHTGMETDCLECHTVPASHYGDDCARCHDPSVPWAETQFPHSASLDCLECHDRPHQAYAGVSCAQCHSGLGVTWLFTHPQLSSCVTCHEAQRPVSHSQGDCVNCHKPPTWKPAAHPDASSSCIACHKPPHRADYPVGCTSCHPLVGVAWKPALHVRPMTCTLCHVSPADTTYTNHPDANCESCHDIPPKAWADALHPTDAVDCLGCHAAPAGHPALTCTTCHSVPPATWQDGLHPNSGAECTDCHSSPADTTSTLHPDSDCGSCHAIPPARWTAGVHPAADSTCLTCHVPPHRTDYPVACAECHPQVGVAWLPVVHTTYTDCTACHTPPADTANTNHPDLDCGTCHAIPPAVWQDGVHPDAASDCLTCHMPPHRDDYPVACASCHPQVGVAWLPAIHTTDPNCILCHTPPATNHTKRVDCVSCHDPSRPWTEPIIP